MNLLDVVARADDTTFGILYSPHHELWSLRMGTSLEDRPRYTPTTCFETFPFPKGLSPADTAHQKTEPLAVGPQPHPLPGGEGVKPETGALIPAGLAGAVRSAAEAIARAAHRLNALREAWPGWMRRIRI